MPNLGPFPAFPLLEHDAASILGQQDRAPIDEPELPCAELAAVQQCQCDPVRQRSPELLHQIEREARPPRSVAMEEAHLRIETLGLQRRPTVTEK
jgi:hypothetical protein